MWVYVRGLRYQQEQKRDKKDLQVGRVTEEVVWEGTELKDLGRLKESIVIVANGSRREEEGIEGIGCGPTYKRHA